MATEAELRDLNVAVYSVEPDHSKIKYTDKKDNQLEKNEKNVIKAGKRKFKVLSVINGEHGFQGMAVAPIINGKADKSQVTVVAAATNIKDWDDTKAAFEAISSKGSPQTKVADEYVGQLRKDHAEDWKIIQLSGYSQSAYMLKVGAHYQIPTTVFNGWFNYDSLNSKERKYLSKNSHLYLNYRHRTDWVTFINGMNQDKLLKPNDFGTIVWVEGNSHMLDSWHFDEATGQVKIPNTSGNTEGKKRQNNHSIMLGFVTQLTKIDQIKSTLKSSKGGLSKAEEIYLDSKKALLTVNTCQSLYQNEIDEFIQIYKKAITGAEDLWQETLSESRAEITESSETEMLDYLAEVFAAKQNIVDEPTDYFQKKITQAKTVIEDFETIAKKIKSKIDELVLVDQQIASRLVLLAESAIMTTATSVFEVGKASLQVNPEKTGAESSELKKAKPKTKVS